MNNYWKTTNRQIKSGLVLSTDGAGNTKYPRDEFPKEWINEKAAGFLTNR